MKNNDQYIHKNKYNFMKKNTRESEHIQFVKEDLDYVISHAFSLRQFESISSSRDTNIKIDRG